MGFTYSVKGQEEAARRIRQVVPVINKRVQDAVMGATLNLISHIKTDKLQGGHPLHRRSGNLTDNIIHDETSSEGLFESRVYVGTGAPYGKVHEFGLTVTRMMTVAWGRPVKNPHPVTAHYPKRSFMYSTFDEQREAIIQRIKAAVDGTL